MVGARRSNNQVRHSVIYGSNGVSETYIDRFYCLKRATILKEVGRIDTGQLVGSTFKNGGEPCLIAYLLDRVIDQILKPQSFRSEGVCDLVEVESGT